MGYTSVEFVKVLSQIRYDDLGFSSESGYDEFVQRLIDYASGLVDDYCGQAFSDPVPPAISYATAMIVVNMLHEALHRKINPTVQSTNIVAKIVEQDAFKESIKRLLDHYKTLNASRG